MYNKLPVKERIELMKSYRKANKDMSYRDMVKDYNDSYEKFQDGGKKSFNDWYKTVPSNKADTSSYNLRRAYELAPQKDLDNFVKDPNAHLYSTYENKETGIYEFMKSKNHPTIQKELEWFNSNDPEAIKFRKNYKLDTSKDYYQYVPQHHKYGGIQKFDDGGTSGGTKNNNVPTRTDSLNVYNNALQLKGFYDKLKPYYEKPIINTDLQFTEYLDNGSVQQNTVSHPNVTEANKNIIRANKNPNVSYLSDMVTGAIDPNAPLLRYDKRITPQGTINYYPANAVSKYFKAKKIIPANKPSYDLEMEYSKAMNQGDAASATKFMNKYKINSTDVKTIDIFAKAISDNLPGNNTTIPYYDLLAIKPYDMLTPEEKELRVKKYGTTGFPKDYVNPKPKVVDKLIKTNTVIKSKPKENFKPKDMEMKGLWDISSEPDINPQLQEIPTGNYSKNSKPTPVDTELKRQWNFNGPNPVMEYYDKSGKLINKEYYKDMNDFKKGKKIQVLDK